MGILARPLFPRRHLPELRARHSAAEWRGRCVPVSGHRSSASAVHGGHSAASGHWLAQPGVLAASSSMSCVWRGGGARGFPGSRAQVAQRLAYSGPPPRSRVVAAPPSASSWALRAKALGSLREFAIAQEDEATFSRCRSARREVPLDQSRTLYVALQRRDRRPDESILSARAKCRHKEPY